MKRSRLVLAQAACLFVLLTTLWLGYRSWSSENGIFLRPPLPPHSKGNPKNTAGQEQNGGTISDSNVLAYDSLIPGGEVASKTRESVSTASPSTAKTPVADTPKTQTSTKYAAHVKSILDPDNSFLPRLECPAANLTRYAYLQSPSHAATVVDDQAPLKYIFALNLRQAAGVLPRLLGSVVQAVRLLGPTACLLSIVEGHSDDGTLAVLEALRPEFARIGLRYRLQSSALDPAAGARIERLAQLRNLALDPLLSTADNARVPADAATTVVFLNDVAPCADDILELVHQRKAQEAHMTCALDWTYVGRDPTFYDVWVARALSGGPFFDIPADGNWNSAWNLLPAPQDAEARQRLAAGRPFQVYACWNGAVAFGAGPLLGLPPSPGGKSRGHGVPEGAKVAFRASREGECYMGEPTLFCKDLWWTGYGRIAVVPSVNLEYSDEAAKKIKQLKGYTSDWTAREDAEANEIAWVAEPPEQVKCMPTWADQSWRPWNEMTS